MGAEQAREYSRGKLIEQTAFGPTYRTQYHHDHTNTLVKDLGLGALSGTRHKIDLRVRERLADLGRKLDLWPETLYVFGGRGEILDLFYLDNQTQLVCYRSVQVGVCAWASIGQRDAVGVRIRCRSENDRGPRGDRPRDPDTDVTEAVGAGGDQRSVHPMAFALPLKNIFDTNDFW
jgi:hypothetical protein